MNSPAFVESRSSAMMTSDELTKARAMATHPTANAVTRFEHNALDARVHKCVCNRQTRDTGANDNDSTDRPDYPNGNIGSATIEYSCDHLKSQPSSRTQHRIAQWAS